MANSAAEDLMRPAPLALAAVAIVGWLLVGYFSSRASEAQTQMREAVSAAESARTAMAADLQNFQKASGSLADMHFVWQGTLPNPQSYSVRGRFDRLSMRAYARLSLIHI